MFKKPVPSNTATHTLGQNDNIYVTRTDQIINKYNKNTNFVYETKMQLCIHKINAKLFIFHPCYYHVTMPQECFLLFIYMNMKNLGSLI